MLSSDLVGRLRERIADPAARTDRIDPARRRSFLGGAFATTHVNLGTELPPGPATHPAPASHEDVAAAEAGLGLALPEDLRQLYTEVANGGFGPGGGLASLKELTGRYRALLVDPPGEGGQGWPKHLLPFNLTEPGLDCYDLESGRVVFWDEESLADGPSDRVWKRSFRTTAETLGAWLEDWLSRPPLSEQMDRQMEEALLQGLRATLAHWRAMTPEERAEYGLPAEGWEQVLFGHLGIDLEKL